MIQRWTIHFEWNWGYRPHFYIRRNPKHGDRVIDGGEPGTLVRCKECGDGFLHKTDEDNETSPKKVFLDITNSPSKYEVGNKLWTRRAEYRVALVWEYAGRRHMELHKIPGTELPPPPSDPRPYIRSSEEERPEMVKDYRLEQDIVSVQYQLGYDDVDRLKMELGSNSMHYQPGDEVFYQGERLVVEDVVTQVLFLRRAR